MSIKFGLLALLSDGPRYGAWLRQEFDTRTGGTWPLNVGQVYTTLGRLERDGLVTDAGRDADGTISYRLTPAGEDALHRWWQQPVDRSASPRDELTIKLALAVTVEGVDVAGLIQRQRAATLGRLQSLTRLKRSSDAADLPWQLVLENLIFMAEAEIRWLDHVEATVIRAGTRGRAGAGSGSVQVADPAPVGVVAGEANGADHDE